MYFNLDDREPDFEGLESAISRRESFLLSVALHVVAVLGFLFLPAMLPVSTPETLTLEQQAAEARAREADSRRFVFVQPRSEFEARRPPQMPELSDRDRTAQAPERAPNPTNPLPFSRGNTSEMVDEPATRPAPPQPQPQPSPAEAGDDAGRGTPGQPPGEAPNAPLRGLAGPSLRSADGGGGGAALGDRLGQALKDVQRYYTADQVFNNPQGGGGQYGSAIQFDTKGVEFGPWIRRFIAQIKRNWDIPYAAMSLRGRVVVTFNVHKDGRITDIAVVGPSGVDGFNHSSFNAIAASSPTQPLPPEYPADQAFFTVTFYYNESPPR